MQSWVTSPSFIVEQPVTSAWPTTKPISPWSKPIEEIIQPYQIDEKLKQAFGIELAKATNSFEAACKIFNEETSKALWISVNWLNDPIVIASRDIYLKNLELAQTPLDREQLAAKVLKMAEGERVERNGILLPTIEAKDRLVAYKLYSDILGYTGKVEIDNSTGKTLINEMTIKLVKADTKIPVTIDNSPNLNVKSEITNKSPIVLKMVSNS